MPTYIYIIDRILSKEGNTSLAHPSIDFHISPKIHSYWRIIMNFNGICPVFGSLYVLYCTYESVTAKVDRVMVGLQEVFSRFKSATLKQFTLGELEAELTKELGEKVLTRDKFSLLLDIFTEYVNENAAFTQQRNQLRVLRKRKQVGGDESVYFVSNSAYARLSSYFARYLTQCAPTELDNSFHHFYPLTQNKSIEIMPVLQLLELLDLCSNEIRGGEKAEVFIRINDPAKLMRLSATGKYKNEVLQTIRERHRNSANLLSAFFRSSMSTEDRWELIEQYFLGNEDYVRNTLHLDY